MNKDEIVKQAEKILNTEIKLTKEFNNIIDWKEIENSKNKAQELANQIKALQAFVEYSKILQQDPKNAIQNIFTFLQNLEPEIQNKLNKLLEIKLKELSNNRI